MMMMMTRLKQRKRSWLATKLWQTKLLQLLKQSGDNIIVIIIIIIIIAIFITSGVIILMINMITRDDCENDLAEAIPALQSAINSLNTLKPSDITVVKISLNTHHHP